MEMTPNETSYALLKSVIAEGVDAYEVRFMIHFPGSRVSDFAGNLYAQKRDKALTKPLNITGVQYFCGLLYCLRAHQQE